MDQYILISHPNFWEECKEVIGNEHNSGVYKLHCLKEDKQGYIPIGRLLRKDDEGILYIGAGKLLLARVTHLMMALRSAVGGLGYDNIGIHSCGFKYKSNEIQKVFPYDNLCVTLNPIDVNQDPYLFEREKLEQYEKRYGEAPPFNEARSRAKKLII